VSARRPALVHASPGLVSAHLPRSLRVEQILRQRLQHDYQPGSRFSSEPELCQEFRASRTLIRGVLARLAREGLVQRKARRGTFVRARRSRTHAPQLSDLVEHLLSFRRNTRVKVLEMRTTLGEAAVRARLHLPPAEPLVVI
jgi:DNA-binding GntR family transcriptional regulator